MRGLTLCPWSDAQKEDNEITSDVLRIFETFFLMCSCFPSSGKAVLGARVIREGKKPGRKLVLNP